MMNRDHEHEAQIVDYDEEIVRIIGPEGHVTVSAGFLVYVLQQLDPNCVKTDFKDWQGIEGK